MPKRFAIIPDSDLQDDSLTARLIAQSDLKPPLKVVLSWNSAEDYETIVRADFGIVQIDAVLLTDDVDGSKTSMHICSVTRSAGP